MNKSEFVRQFPYSVSRSEVVAKAKAQGIKLTEQYVSSIRTAARKRTGTKRGTRGGAAAGGSEAAVDREFLGLVVDVGLQRAEELLDTVRRKAAALLR